MARSHVICVSQTRGVDEVGLGSATYMVSLPRVLHEVKCLVPGCPSVAHSAGRPHEHFMYCHFRSKVAVVQEGMETLPCCDWQETHMPVGRNIRRRKTVHFDKNTQMSWRRWDVAIASRCLEATFSLTGDEEAEYIKGMEVFKYLGWLLEWLDEDW